MCGARRRARARVGLMAATGCSAYLALARDDARPVRRLPDVEPYDDFRPSRWCHGDILQSSGRSEALPRHSHYLAVAPAPGSFLSVVRSGGRLRWQHPPGPLRGSGRRPSGGARSAAPRGLPVSWAMRRMLATEAHRWLITDCNGEVSVPPAYRRDLANIGLDGYVWRL